MIPLFLMTLNSPEDREFLNQLYLDNQCLLFHTVSKYTLNPDDQEDIVQSALLKMAEHVDRLKEVERCTLVSYVVILTKNVAINYLKHESVVKKHAQPLPDGVEDFEHPDPSPSVEDIVVRRDQLAPLKEIWPRLPAKDQLLLSGKYIVGLSDAELAKLLNCKPGSIRMKLTRARRNAMNEMQKGGYCHDES